jgi:hypothetical protein
VALRTAAACKTVSHGSIRRCKCRSFSLCNLTTDRRAAGFSVDGFNYLLDRCSHPAIGACRIGVPLPSWPITSERHARDNLRTPFSKTPATFWRTRGVVNTGSSRSCRNTNALPLSSRLSFASATSCQLVISRARSSVKRR